MKSGAAGAKSAITNLQNSLSGDELRILHSIRARQMLRTEDTLNLDNFGKDAIDGMVPRLKQGSLTLVKVDESDVNQEPDFTDLFDLVKPGNTLKPAEVR